MITGESDREEKREERRPFANGARGPGKGGKREGEESQTGRGIINRWKGINDGALSMINHCGVLNIQKSGM